MAYFKDFPLVPYSFGSGEAQVAFPALNVYLDIADQIKDQVSAYRYYFIQEGDRPDQVSYYLYDDPQYYWTFFLMNDHLKEGGWPLSERLLREKVQKDHPDYVLTTRDSLAGRFKIGQTVRGSSSSKTGLIDFRNLDLGQLFLSGADGDFSNGEVITSTTATTFESITIVGGVEEYNAIDHYVDGDGKRVDINPFAEPSSLYTPVTKLEKYRAVNEDRKRIKVLKPDVLNQLAINFQKELLA